MLKARPLLISQVALARSPWVISSARRSRTPCMSSAVTSPCSTTRSVSVTIRHAWRQDAVRHAEHAIETPIDDKQPAITIEHQQALQHVVERGVKALLLCVQSQRGPLAFLGDRKSGFRLGARNLCRLQLFIATQVAYSEQNGRADHQLQQRGRGN